MYVFASIHWSIHLFGKGNYKIVVESVEVFYTLAHSKQLEAKGFLHIGPGSHN